jgi:hypothetical protein
MAKPNYQFEKRRKELEKKRKKEEKRQLKLEQKESGAQESPEETAPAEEKPVIQEVAKDRHLPV